MAKSPKKPKHSFGIPKSILILGKTLSILSPYLATLYAAKLFTTPVRFKTPRREMEMDTNSKQTLVHIPKINKSVVIYEYGKSDKKIILVHGWSGRGTQLVNIANELLKQGYSVLTFDAPGHGKSPGKTTLMLEFIAIILQLKKEYGPFEAGIGHSLGGMSLLNSMKQGLQLNHLVTIGSGDIIKDIMDEFVEKLNLKLSISDRMEQRFNKIYKQEMSDSSAYLAAKEIKIPVLIIHDKNDLEVPVSCAHHIYENLSNGELMITEKLGHRKIISDNDVINKIIGFIKP
ncbi:MAG: alpha/beta fold hydrolase [Flavobacterium sp.]